MKSLERAKEQSRNWYQNNKEFLRAWELTPEFKSYRSIRLKIQKVSNRLNYLQKVFDEIPKPKKRNYLHFFYDEINKLKQKKRKLLELQKKEFILMREAKIRAENKFLKDKLKIFNENGGKSSVFELY